MNKITPFLTIGLMVFSVTLATYTLTKEVLSGSKTEYQTVLFINKNQILLKRVALASIQPGSNSQYIGFSNYNRPQNCNAQSIQKTFTNIIPAIKTSRSL